MEKRFLCLVTKVLSIPAVKDLYLFSIHQVTNNWIINSTLLNLGALIADEGSFIRLINHLTDLLTITIRRRRKLFSNTIKYSMLAYRTYVLPSCHLATVYKQNQLTKKKRREIMLKVFIAGRKESGNKCHVTWSGKQQTFIHIYWESSKPTADLATRVVGMWSSLPVEEHWLSTRILAW